jgi:hypothetical protein
MLSFGIFYQRYAEEIIRDTRMRLPRHGLLVTGFCEAFGTMHSIQPNRMIEKRLAEIIMGNHYVKRRLNLREKKQGIAGIALDCIKCPQWRIRCIVSVDRYRRKVVPYDYCRKSKGRNLVNPIRPTIMVETQPQGRARAERVEDAGESECFAVMAKIRLARMERKKDRFRKEAHFQRVYFGDILPTPLINHSGVNR